MEECVICLDTIKNPCKTNCGHKFHHTCLFKWIESDKTSCPLCRKNLEGPDISYIKVQTLATKDIILLGSQFLEKICPNFLKGISERASQFVETRGNWMTEMYAEQADKWDD